MSIKQLGGVFGRNPTFNDVTIEGELILNDEIFTGLDFQGSWNASTNTPTLASGVGTTGEFYIVSVAGTTNLDGITNWGVGDWAMFSGSAWQRVEGNADGNFVNLSVSNEATMNGLTVSSDSGGPVYLQDSNATATYNISELSNNAGNFNVQTRDSSGVFVSTDYQIVKNATGADYHRWFTQGIERLRLDSSGNLLAGKTSTGVATAGIELNGANDLLRIARDGGVLQELNRITSDGDFIEFRRDNTPLASIGTAGGELFIAFDGTTDSGLRFRDSGEIIPVNSGGAGTNGVSDLGSSGFRFKDLYLSGGVVFGTTGGAVTSKTLDDYEEGTFTPVIADAATGGNSGSSTTAEGFYTKIGQTVHVYMFVSNIVTTGMTAANTIYFRDLPFTTASTNAGRSQGSIRADQVTFTGYLVAQTGANVSYVTISNIVSGNNDIDTKVQDFTSGGADVFISLTYRTA